MKKQRAGRRTKLVTLPMTAKRTKSRTRPDQVRYISKKEDFDPWLRVASAVIINAFEQYRKAHTYLKNVPLENKGGIVERRAKEAVELIKSDLLSPDNPNVMYLEANRHAMDLPKIKRTLKEIEKNA